MLPVDPLLGVQGPPLPYLTQTNAPQPPRVMSATVVVTEGIPPVAARMIEKIRHWEFVDLALLLESADQGYSPGPASGRASPSTPLAKSSLSHQGPHHLAPSLLPLYGGSFISSSHL